MLVIQQSFLSSLILETNKVSRKGGSMETAIWTAQFGEFCLFPYDAFELLAFIKDDGNLFAWKEIIAEFLHNIRS